MVYLYIKQENDPKVLKNSSNINFDQRGYKIHYGYRKCTSKIQQGNDLKGFINLSKMRFDQRVKKFVMGTKIG